MRSPPLAGLILLVGLLYAGGPAHAQAAPSERVRREAERVLEWIKFHGRLPQRTPAAKPHPSAALPRPPVALPRLEEDLLEPDELPVIEAPWPVKAPHDGTAVRHGRP